MFNFFANEQILTIKKHIQLYNRYTIAYKYYTQYTSLE